MAKRFLQREGIDFDEVFALVVRIKTIGLVIYLANINNWSMCQMDLKCEFLSVSLDEEAYVSQPVCFEKEVQEKKVHKLHKTFYGLKQAPRAWNKNTDDFLREVGFMKCETKNGV